MDIIKNYENRFYGRYETMKMIHDLAQERNAKFFIETGTARRIGAWGGDGLSTHFFGEYCKMNDGHLWTCDIDSKAIEISKEITKDFSENITYVVDDSLNFLKEYVGRMDVVYLDSFDSVLGREDEASQHNLKEIMIVLSKIHNDTIIGIDDYHSGLNIGKGIYSVPYLINNGWEMISGKHNCQAVFIKKYE